eukprot:TRINITY_DN1732_c0_g1_i4.p1 TRINITY_DN1732_c0_g1~~TRINITY_DN1732_c0_g1_i4.p1  ORF type:complete len:302 (+),score=66.90 TRINITY_DN1732_c0_g1_i4:54-908(+)
MGAPRPSVFSTVLRAVPLSQCRPELVEMGMVVMPPSKLDEISTLELEFPLVFRVCPVSGPNKTSHCGVVEFTAEEGTVYVPDWLLLSLGAFGGDRLNFTTCSLPLGTHVKLQARSKAFLDISNPRAVLEKKLRDYPTLTKGDVIYFSYANKDFEMIVKDTKPSNAISILNADVIVDFDAPEDYEEPTPVPPAPQQAKYNPEEDHHTEDPLRVESYSSLEEESSEEDTTNLFIGKAESVGGKKIADKTTVLGMMGTKKQEDAKVLVMEGGKILYKVRVFFKHLLM